MLYRITLGVCCALLAACGGGGSAAPVTVAQTTPLTTGSFLGLRGANGYTISIALGPFPSGFPAVSMTLAPVPSTTLPPHSYVLVDTAGATFSASPSQNAFYLPFGGTSVTDSAGRAVPFAVVSVIDASAPQAAVTGFDLLQADPASSAYVGGLSALLIPIVPGDRYVFAVYR